MKYGSSCSFPYKGVRIPKIKQEEFFVEVSVNNVLIDEPKIEIPKAINWKEKRKKKTPYGIQEIQEKK